MREIIKVLRKPDQYSYFITYFDKIMLKLTANEFLAFLRGNDELRAETAISDPELLLTLEPEELAGVLLPILKKQARKDGTVSGYNFSHNFRQMQEIFPREYVPAVS